MRMHVLIMQLVEKVPNGNGKFVSRLYSTPLLRSKKNAVHPALQIMSLKSLYNDYLGKEEH